MSNECDHTWWGQKDPADECICNTIKKLPQGSSTVDRWVDYPEFDYFLSCDHAWKLYSGLNDVFEYCEKCDEKRKVG